MRWSLLVISGCALLASCAPRGSSKTAADADGGPIEDEPAAPTAPTNDVDANTERKTWEARGKELADQKRYADAAQAYEQALRWTSTAQRAALATDALLLARAYRDMGAQDKVREVGLRYSAVARALRAGDAAPHGVPFEEALAHPSPRHLPVAPSPVLSPAVATPGAPPPAAPAPPTANAAFPSDEPAPAAAPPAPAHAIVATRGTPADSIPSAVPPQPAPGAATDAAQKVAALRADFRTCYLRELSVDRGAAGSVYLMLLVGAAGQVSDVRGTSVGMRAELVDCMLERAAQTVFAAPQGGSAVIAVPVTFIKQ